MNLKRFFPIMEWLPNYQKSWFVGDLSAGLTVGIMLIPQGMAYAMIAGLPPVYGLYAGLIPNIIYAITGSSRKLAVGPVALDSLIVASGLAAMKLASIDEYISMAIFLALFVGLLQVAMGFLRFGFLANFLSRPVISGFTSAAALVIAISQMKYLLGLRIDTVGTLNTLKALWFNISQTKAWDLAIGVIAIAAIIGLKKINKKIPAAMIFVVLSILGIFFFYSGDGSVTLLGLIPEGLPAFQFHSAEANKWAMAFPVCFALAFIAFAEAMTMAKAVEEKTQQFYTNPNQELRALGISNIVGSFFQSFPANAGFSRTAVNVAEGAKTGLSSIISAAVVAMTLLFLTPYFQFLPKTVLSAIILVAVYGLIEIRYPILLFKQRKDEFILFLVTFFTTILVGITEGIIFGVLFSLLLLVNRTSRPHIAILGKIKGMEYFKNIDRFSQDIELHDEILMLRFDAQLVFANMHHFKRALLTEVEKKKDTLKYVILNAEPISYIDSSAAIQLVKIITDLRERGITFKMASAIGPLRDILQNNGLAEVIGQENLYVRTADAYEDCLAKDGKSDIQNKISLQHRR